MADYNLNYTGAEIDAAVSKATNLNIENGAGENALIQKGNKACGKGFKILSASISGTQLELTLENTPEIANIAQGDWVSYQLKNNYNYAGKVHWNSYPGYPVIFIDRLPPDDLWEVETDKSYLWLPTKSQYGSSILNKQSSNFGYDNRTNQYSSFATGWENIADGKYSFVAGKKNVAGYSAAAFGANNFSKGEHSATFGDANEVSGNSSLAGGSDNNVAGIDSFAFGHANVIGDNSECTFLAGKRLTATGNYKTVVGKYNTDTAGALFIVGKGMSTNDRSNAFEVYQDGTARIGAMGSANLSVATKQYVDSHSGGGTQLYKHQFNSEYGCYLITTSSTPIPIEEDTATHAYGFNPYNIVGLVAIVSLFGTGEGALTRVGRDMYQICNDNEGEPYSSSATDTVTKL